MKPIVFIYYFTLFKILIESKIKQSSLTSAKCIFAKLQVICYYINGHILYKPRNTYRFTFIGGLLSVNEVPGFYKELTASAMRLWFPMCVFQKINFHIYIPYTYTASLIVLLRRVSQTVCRVTLSCRKFR